MRLKLHQYQIDVLEFIEANQHVGLFLEPGLGKTIISLAYIRAQKELNPTFQTLIIGPGTVINNVWPEELGLWSVFNSLTYSIFHYSKRKSFNPNADIILTSPHQLSRFFTLIGTNSFDLMIIDESTLFKSHSSIRFKLLKAQLHRMNKRIILTGTPIPNGYQDLWSQIFLLDEGETLGKNISAFRRSHCSQSPYCKHVWTLRPESAKLIDKLINPFCYSLQVDSSMHLPEPVYTRVFNTLPDKLINKYKAFYEELVVELNGDNYVAPNTVVKLLKCQQFANGAMFDEDSVIHEIHKEKLESLERLVEDLGAQHCIIFYNFNSDLHLIRRHFSKKFTHLKSGIPEIEFSQIISDWNAKKIPIMVAQPMGLSHGLNLQYGGHHIIWFSLTYNLELYQQANARLYRQHQKDNVIIHHLLTESTIDSVIYDVVVRKRGTQESFLAQLRNFTRGNL